MASSILKKFQQFVIIVIAINFLSSCRKEENNNANCSAGSDAITFNHNGQSREYLLYKPTNLPSNAPLVFVLHGSDQQAEHLYNYFGFNQVADTAKFAVCYPQGSDCYWQEDDINSNDIDFLKSLAQYLQTEHNLSADKTFATGFSAGGGMSYLLGLEANDVFKAIAPVAGGISETVWSDKNPQNPIPVFVIHGTADQIVPINGGGKGNLEAVQSIVNYFKNFNLCSSTTNSQFNTNTIASYHLNGTNNNEVWYYSISGQDHIFPGDSDPGVGSSDISGFHGASEIWRFFRRW